MSILDFLMKPSSGAQEQRSRLATFCGPVADYDTALRLARFRQRYAGTLLRGPGRLARRPIFCVVRRTYTHPTAPREHERADYLVYSERAYATRVRLARDCGADLALLGTPVAWVLASGELYELAYPYGRIPTTTTTTTTHTREEKSSHVTRS